MSFLCSLKSLCGASAVLAAASLVSAQDIELTLVAGGMTDPVDIQQPTTTGEDRLFVAEQSGFIRIIENGSVLPTPFLNISSLISTGFERGLLGFAFHPDYGEGIGTDFVFVNYTNTSGHTVIARYEVSGDPNVLDTGSVVTLLTINQPFTNHNAGGMAFGPDGMLWIPTGDGGSSNDPDCRAQDDTSMLGKILRLDVNDNVLTPPYYGVPVDNPNPGATAPLNLIWAKGLRNPYRFSFDRQSGDIWIGDVGQGAREEVNHVPVSTPGGLNFGWKIMEGTLCTGNTTNCTAPPACNAPSLTLPVHEYSTGVDGQAIIGGFVYRGTEIPSLVGRYIYTDYSSKNIWALTPGTWANELLMTATQTGLLRSLGQDRHNELYAALGTSVYKITPVLSAVNSWQVYE